jgi:hypothetical protein
MDRVKFVLINPTSALWRARAARCRTPSSSVMITQQG